MTETLIDELNSYVRSISDVVMKLNANLPLSNKEVASFQVTCDQAITCVNQIAGGAAILRLTDHTVKRSLVKMKRALDSIRNLPAHAAILKKVIEDNIEILRQELRRELN